MRKIDPMPKIRPLRPETEIEERVREALYGEVPLRRPAVSVGFWRGMASALFLMAGFVACGLVLAWLLR